jgi:hypothetical protein
MKTSATFAYNGKTINFTCATVAHWMSVKPTSAAFEIDLNDYEQAEAIFDYLTSGNEIPSIAAENRAILTKTESLDLSMMIPSIYNTLFTLYEA